MRSRGRAACHVYDGTRSGSGTVQAVPKVEMLVAPLRVILVSRVVVDVDDLPRQKYRRRPFKTTLRIFSLHYSNNKRNCYNVVVDFVVVVAVVVQKHIGNPFPALFE